MNWHYMNIKQIWTTGMKGIKLITMNWIGLSLTGLYSSCFLCKVPSDELSYPRTVKWCYFYPVGDITCCILGYFQIQPLPVKKVRSQNKRHRSFILHHFLNTFQQPQCTAAMLQSVHHKTPKQRCYTSIPPWLM